MSFSIAGSSVAGSQVDIKYYLKFALNVPYADVKRMLETDSRLLYALKDCSRAGRVNWKLKLYRHRSGEDDEYLAVYLKFEPQVCTESVSCTTEFSVKLSGPESRSLERQSSSPRQFTKSDDSWGWSQFAKTSDLEAFVSEPQGAEILRISGVIKIFESSKMLYPHRRHNFTRAQNGADFRLQVGQVTFHVHKAMLALNSDHFASLFSRNDSEEVRSGVVGMPDEKVQDVHLMLQYMYPGYSRVLEESTLMPLSRLSARYHVHSLTWACMQYIDNRLGQSPEPEKAMKYYYACISHLRCSDLSEQCVKAASSHAWRRVKDSPHFKLLDESEKAAFLEAFLDFKEERRRTPLPTSAEGVVRVNGTQHDNGGEPSEFEGDCASSDDDAGKDADDDNS